MIGVGLVYAGLLTTLIGITSVVRPAWWPRIRTHRRGAWVLASGLLLIGAGVALPAPETRVTAPVTRLDAFVPVYQFSESHTTRVAAPPERTYAAVKAVTAGEIVLFRTLIWIRRFGRSGPEDIFNAPDRMPILEVATRTSFLLLEEKPNRELVVGTIVLAPPSVRGDRLTPDVFKGLDAPGFAKAVMNFRVEPDGRGGSVLTTETRVFATDATALRGVLAGDLSGERDHPADVAAGHPNTGGGRANLTGFAHPDANPAGLRFRSSHQSGQIEAFERLAERRHSRLLRHARRLTPLPQESGLSRLRRSIR